MGLFSDHPFEYHDELYDTLKPVVEFYNKYWKLQTEGSRLNKEAISLSFKIAVYFAKMDGVDYQDYMYNQYIDESCGYFCDPTGKHFRHELSEELLTRYNQLVASFDEFDKKQEGMNKNDYEYLHNKMLDASKQIEYYAKQCTPTSLWTYVCTKIVPELNKKMAPMSITVEQLEKLVTPPTKK